MLLAKMQTLEGLEGSNKFETKTMNEIALSITACQDMQIADNKTIKKLQTKMLEIQDWKEEQEDKQNTKKAKNRGTNHMEEQQIEAIEIVVNKLQATVQERVLPVVVTFEGLTEKVK